MTTVRSEYLGDLRTKAVHLQSGTSLITDAPLDNQGKGEAFSPTDLVATALGSCMMTIMGIVAGRDEIDLRGTDFAITKGMSTELPRKIVKIEVVLNVVSDRALSDGEKAKLERAARTCPVALSLHPDIEQIVEFTWKIG